jgi:hypothetical protein
MSIKKTARDLLGVATYNATCERCKTATVEFKADEEIDTESLLDNMYWHWKVVTWASDVEHVTLLCPDCPTCEDIGHTWEPVEDGIVIIEARLRCSICGLAPHVPEKSWLTEAEALDIVITPGPNLGAGRV